MKKTRVTVACALAVITTLTLLPGKPGLFGVDVVSAATGETTTTPTTPTTPSTNPTTPGILMQIKRLLRYGSLGSEVRTLQTLLNNKGYSLKVDGAFGKLTLAAVKDFQSKNGLVVDGIVGPKTLAKLAEVAATPTTPTVPVEATVLKIGRADYAAHGTKCFTSAVVAMAGDKIVAASIDDYQFMAKDTSTGVPNSDKDFGTYFKDATRVLGSKRTNAATYSANMATAGATIPIDKNLDAIQEFVKGKTIAQLEEIIKTNGTDPKVDAVTGATLTDTNGYLNAIVAAAKASKENSSVKVDAAALSTLNVKRTDYAAHGTKCFTSAVVIMAGDKIVGTSIDDYQFMAKDTSIGVPNSDKDFGTYLKDPTRVLGSKRTNTVSYSANMANSGATIAIDKNFDAIQAFVAGKTVAELEAIIKTNGTDPKVDAVTSATLTDTNGYLNAIAAAAKASSTAPVEKVSLNIGRADYAAHGTKCFTSAVVAMAGDKIVAASIDDYQFMAKDTSTGVPNSDKDFGTYFKDATRVLGSKRTNTTSYSANMANSGATIAIDKNFDAIQDFVKGKTIAQLEEIIKTNGTDPKVDAVTSATLTDTNGYLNAIVAAAKASKENSSIKVDASLLNALKVGRADYAAHGTKCFTAAVVIMAGDKIAGASIDDYQFMAKDTSIGVPNSDKDFGTYFKDPTRVLGSKRTNTVSYSANMANSGATIAIDKNFDAIQAFVAGKTVAELEAIIKTNGTDPKVDAVTSATLTDTNGYLNAIAAAAKNAK